LGLFFAGNKSSGQMRPNNAKNKNLFFILNRTVKKIQLLIQTTLCKIYILTILQIKEIILHVYRHIPEATSILRECVVSDIAKRYPVNGQVFIS
jgi:hypothetical protein